MECCARSKAPGWIAAVRWPFEFGGGRNPATTSAVVGKRSGLSRHHQSRTTVANDLESLDRTVRILKAQMVVFHVLELCKQQVESRMGAKTRVYAVARRQRCDQGQASECSDASMILTNCAIDLYKVPQSTTQASSDLRPLLRQYPRSSGL